jgi:hypothetical protein
MSKIPIFSVLIETAISPDNDYLVTAIMRCFLLFADLCT